MLKKPKKPQLKLVTASTTQASRKLGVRGRALWNSINAGYDIHDSGGIEILMQACSALDRAEECSDQIDIEGPTITTKSGMREHPLLKMELQNRAFVCRSLQRLGLNIETIKPIGRPSGYSPNGN
jgi:hypothetical protein